MQKSKRKRRIAALVALILVASLAAGLFLMPGKEVEAASRLYGVQQLVDELSAGQFTILELVPDQSDASIGFLISGSEPSIAPNVMAAVEPEDGSLFYQSARKSVAFTLYSRLNMATGEALVNYNAGSFYSEQILEPEDTTGWEMIDFTGTGHAEYRVGYFAGREDAGLTVGDYYYQPEVTFDLYHVDPHTQAISHGGDTLETGITSVTCYCTVTNSGEYTLTSIRPNLVVEGGALTVVGSSEDPNASWSGTQLTIGTLAPGESATVSFEVTLPAVGQNRQMYFSLRMPCRNSGRSSVQKYYYSDGYNISWSQDTAYLLTADRASERLSARDMDDYHLYDPTQTEGQGEPDYVWYDDEKGQPFVLEIPRLWYHAEVSSTNLFSTKVLELEANASALFRRMRVITVTPSELEDLLGSGQFSFSEVDLLYISNSSVFGSSFDCDNLPVISFGSYSSKNDISSDTANSILEACFNNQLPIVMDESLTALSEDTEAYGIITLAEELYSYAYSLAFSGVGNTLSSTRAVVGENVCIYNDSIYGNLTKADIDQLIFTYNSGNDASRGETAAVGMSQIIDEIATDNFYNDEDSYTAEYHLDASGNEVIEISKATIIKYILNFARHRTVLYKDTIRVLDLEPAGYSVLSETMIRGWLGESAEDIAAGNSAIRTISIDQMSTSEFIGKMVDLVATYDLIYIGSGKYDPNVAGSGLVSNGFIYAHVGDGRSVNKTNIRQNETSIEKMYKSGNDITEDKYEDLLEFAEAGYPIVADSVFYSTEDGALNSAVLDKDSYMYKLLDEVGHGYTKVERITETEYKNTPDKTGYVRVVECTLTSETDSVTVERVNNYLYTINTSTRYIFAASEDNQGNSRYQVLSGDLSMDSTISSLLRTVETAPVTLAADRIPERLLWRIARSSVSNSLYRITNTDGKYMQITESGVSLSTSSVEVELQESISNWNNFYLSQAESNNYLNIGNGQAYVVPNQIPGYNARLYLYKVTFGNEVITRPITEAEYNRAVANYGSTSAAEGHGYKRTVYYERTQSNNSLPNVIRRTTGTLTRLAKYINMPRLNLIMVSKPAEYYAEANTTSGVLQTSTINWLQPKNGQYILEYEFEFSNASESPRVTSTYSIHLYADINSDGQFKADEELDGTYISKVDTNKEVDATNLKSGVRYRLTRKITDGHEGLLPWKLVLSINNSDAGQVRAVETGYTAIQPSQTTAVKVLQILPKGFLFSLSPREVVADRTKEEIQFTSMLESVEAALNYDIDIKAIAVNDLNNMSDPQSYLDAYDMLVIGFNDAFGGNDITSTKALNAITSFIESGRSVMFSHDMTSMKNRSFVGSSLDVLHLKDHGWSYNINRYLRSIAGMDRYGYTTISSVTERTANITAEYLEASERQAIEAANKDLPISNGVVYADSIGYSDFCLNRTVSKDGWDYQDGDDIVTNQISQVNEGQITLYPFNVSASSDSGSMTARTLSGSYYRETAESLTISTTHGQYYQLDYNYDKDGDGDNDLVVWYCLAEGSLTSSSTYEKYYGETINNARNNYYLYSVGNIMYTGLGHSGDITVTEMQLFINAMIAASNAGLKSPTVNITSGNSKNASLSDIYVTYDNNAIVDTGTEDFSFYVEDVNLVDGTKTINVWYYYEVKQSEYKAADTNYQTTVDEDGNIVYLKAFSTSSGASDYVGKALTPVNADTGQKLSVNIKNFYKTVANGTLAWVSVNDSWISTQLGKIKDGFTDSLKSYVDGDETIYVHPERLWIGARTTFTGGTVQQTEYGFSCVNFKKRSLLPLR